MPLLMQARVRRCSGSREKKRGGSFATWDPCTCITAGKSMLLAMTLLLREDLCRKSVGVTALDAPDRRRCDETTRDDTSSNVSAAARKRIEEHELQQ